MKDLKRHESLSVDLELHMTSVKLEHISGGIEPEYSIKLGKVFIKDDHEDCILT